MHIRWTDPAVRDLIQICDYLEQHANVTIARRVALTIYQSIDMLSQFPESGRTGRKPETRELVFTGLPYLAIYRISHEQIEILRILHGAQQWP